MKKKFISSILIVCFVLFSSPVQAQNPTSQRVRAEASSAGSYHTSAVAMTVWGVILVVGIAAAIVLIHTHSD